MPFLLFRVFVLSWLNGIPPAGMVQSNLFGI